MEASVLLILVSVCSGHVISRNSSARLYYGEVVFTGASITEYYRSEGRDTWNQYYEPLQAANVAFAGDSAQRLLDRIRNEGLYDNLDSRIAVLSDVGSNSLSGGWGEQQVVDQYGEILGLLKQYFPGVKIILVALMPRTDGGPELQQKLRNVNDRLRNYDDGNQVRWFTLEDKLSPGIGSVYDDLYWDDKLHLNYKGYRVWAENMAPLFNELYGKMNE